MEDSEDTLLLESGKQVSGYRPWKSITVKQYFSYLLTTGMRYTDIARGPLRFDRATKSLLLATGLPLVDGVFATLVLAGTLNSLSGMMVIAGTIFGGPWMMTVMISEMEGEAVPVRLQRVTHVGTLVIPGAGLVAIVAPTLASLLALDVFQLFSAFVLLTVGTLIANEELGEFLTSRGPVGITPGRLVSVGIIISVGANLLANGVVEPTLVVDRSLALRSMGTAALAIGLAAVTAVLGPTLDEYLELAQFRLGSGIALAVVPLSIWGVVPSLASLAVFMLTSLYAVNVTKIKN